VEDLSLLTSAFSHCHCFSHRSAGLMCNVICPSLLQIHLYQMMSLTALFPNCVIKIFNFVFYTFSSKFLVREAVSTTQLFARK